MCNVCVAGKHVASSMEWTISTTRLKSVAEEHLIGHAVSIRSARVLLALRDELRHIDAATSVGSAPSSWRPMDALLLQLCCEGSHNPLHTSISHLRSLSSCGTDNEYPEGAGLKKSFNDAICGIGITQRIFKMQQCHLAALVRDESVLNGRFGRGHTAFALSLVTDTSDFLVRATRRELDARSIVTGKTCRARVTAVFNGKCSHLLFGHCIRSLDGDLLRDSQFQRTLNSDMCSS